MQRHGSYQRYAQPTGEQRFSIQRYRCVACGRTVSVLPANRLPYRPLEAQRLGAHFDAQAEVGSGPDPPAQQVEAGCLERAWKRFLTRVEVLKNALGQILPLGIGNAQELWKQLRCCLGSTAAILRELAEPGKRSLLGDYRCLRPAP